MEESSFPNFDPSTGVDPHRQWSLPVQLGHARLVLVYTHLWAQAEVSTSGFTILAINCFVSGNDLLGAMFFVLSLGFKQMALYYAPAVGSYLLGKCLYTGPKDGYVMSYIIKPCSLNS